MELYEYTVHELVEMLEKGEITSSNLTKSYFDRIKKLDPKVHAYVSTLENKALEKAKKIDEDRKAGKNVSKFAGIPIGIKDNICITGTKTTCSSKMLENFVAPYNATVIEKLNNEVGSEVIFTDVLFVDNVAGTPNVKNAKVICTVEKHGKQKKITVFKYRPKKKYRKKQGHRQPYTKLVVTKINK